MNKTIALSVEWFKGNHEVQKSLTEKAYMNKFNERHALWVESEPNNTNCF